MFYLNIHPLPFQYQPASQKCYWVSRNLYKGPLGRFLPLQMKSPSMASVHEAYVGCRMNRNADDVHSVDIEETAGRSADDSVETVARIDTGQRERWRRSMVDGMSAVA